MKKELCAGTAKGVNKQEQNKSPKLESLFLLFK